MIDLKLIVICFSIYCMLLNNKIYYSFNINLKLTYEIFIKKF